MNNKQVVLKVSKTEAEIQSSDASEPGRLDETQAVLDAPASAKAIQQYKEAVRSALEREYSEFLYSQSMGSWKHWMYVGRLAKESGLTEEQHRTAQHEVFEAFEKSANSRQWDIFRHGTPEEKKILQDEIALEMHGEGTDA